MNETTTVSDKIASNDKRAVIKFIAIRITTAVACTVATTLVANALEKKLNPSDQEND